MTNPQTNISASGLLQNSLHFPIKVCLNELKWTIYPINLLCGIIGRILVSLIQITDVWDKFGHISMSKTDNTPPPSNKHFNKQSVAEFTTCFHKSLSERIKVNLYLINSFCGILGLILVSLIPIMDMWNTFKQIYIYKKTISPLMSSNNSACLKVYNVTSMSL